MKKNMCQVRMGRLIHMMGISLRELPTPFLKKSYQRRAMMSWTDMRMRRMYSLAKKKSKEKQKILLNRATNL